MHTLTTATITANSRAEHVLHATYTDDIAALNEYYQGAHALEDSTPPPDVTEHLHYRQLVLDDGLSITGIWRVDSEGIEPITADQAVSWLADAGIAQLAAALQ